MTTIGLGIITRNSDAPLLDKALASVIGKVDAIYITVADKEEPSEEVKAIAGNYKANLSHFTWINDFAAARNFNMSLCKEDWYTWMDTDDEVEGMEKAHQFLESVNASIKFVLCTYNYAFYPNGMVATRHPKERFIKMDVPFKWKGKLHETCVSDAEFGGLKCEDIVWNHRTNDARTLESSKRNVEIVQSELAEQITQGEDKIDPRTIFNLGMAYSSVAQRTGSEEDWMLSIRTFQKYLERTGWSEHAYMAFKFIGVGCMQMERPQQALQAFMESWKLCPEYADAYVMMGSAYERMNMNTHAETFYKIALSVGAENRYASDIGSEKLTPLFALAKFTAMRGNIKEAREYIKKFKAIAGDSDDNINALSAEIDRVETLNTQAKAIADQLFEMDEDEQKKAYAAIDDRFKHHPYIVSFRRSKTWKTTTTGKEISIMTGNSIESWSPENAKSGIGGSEEAVIYLSKELVKRGWDVTVYGRVDEPKQYDGVWYKPWYEYSPNEPTDIFIGWRDASVFDYKPNAKKSYLWLHDVLPAQALIESRLKNLTKVIVLSEYHRDLFPHVSPDKIMVSANGLLPEQFEKEVERNPKRVLYTSAPNRGLDCLLQMWPKIKEQVPEAELHWAYGWETFDKLQETNPLARQFKDNVLRLLEQPGVTTHGRIGHEALAELMLSGGVWAYPTEFDEIYCITAIKMQAAGCVPVCTDVAALNETVQFGTKIVTKNIYKDPESQEKFIAAVVEALNNPPDRKAMMEWARTKCSWGYVADQWSNEFSS